MIHNSDGMSKKCNSKSLFFFIFFSPGFAPYFRMGDKVHSTVTRENTLWLHAAKSKGSLMRLK